MTARTGFAVTILAVVFGFALNAGGQGLPFVYEEWETFDKASTNGGLPDDHVFYVKTDGDRTWFGTEDGLALYEDGEWTNWHMEDGLPWKVISGIDVDRKTGDVWLALFGGGVARMSGGRFDHWHQLNSGLVNDVVYNVAVQDHFLWAATTAGASRYDMTTHEWRVFTEKNAPMEEIWNYNVSYDSGKVWLAVWGGGYLEWDVETEVWEEYLDPDGEMEIDLFRDDGPVHVITTGVSYRNGLLWGSTYFGVSRYDGRRWRGYMDHDSGLASNFNNFIQEHNKEGWCCTDKGLSAMMDFDSNMWVTYRHDEETGANTATITAGTDVVEVRTLKGGLPHSFINCADFSDNEDIWVATSKGVARGSGKGYYTGLRQQEARAGE